MYEQKVVFIAMSKQLYCRGMDKKEIVNCGMLTSEDNTT